MAGWVAERRAGTAGDRLFLLSHPPIGRPTDADVREAVAAELTS